MWIFISLIYTHLKCKMRQKFHPFCRFMADLTTRLEFMMFASMRLSFRRLCRLVGDLDVIAVSIAFVLP